MQLKIDIDSYTNVLDVISKHTQKHYLGQERKVIVDIDLIEVFKELKTFPQNEDKEIVSI